MPVVISVFENSPLLTNALKKEAQHAKGQGLYSKQTRKGRLTVITRCEGEITPHLFCTVWYLAAPKELTALHFAKKTV